LTAAETVAVSETVSVTVAVAASVAETATDLVDMSPLRDVRGTLLCRNNQPAPQHVAHNGDAGHSTGTALKEPCPGSVAGRRRAIGAVAALPINPWSTTPMVRRWVAEGGPEGRGQ